MKKYIKMKPVGGILITLLTALPLYAQDNNEIVGQNTPAALERMKMQNLWLEHTSNAAGAILDNTVRYSTVSLGYDIGNGTFRRPQEGKKVNSLDFKTEGGGIYEGLHGMYVWGSFSYSRYKVHKAEYNASLIDPLRGMPFIIADTNRSNWVNQDYNLEMQMTTPLLWNRVIIGITGRYQNAVGAKQLDPRPLVRLSQFMLLPLIRYGFPAVVENGFAIMCTFGYIFWVDLVILVCGILGALTLGVNFKTYKEVCKRTASGVLPVLVTMGSLLIVAYIMQSSSTGMMNLLASDIAAVVGRFYPAAAVLIGSSGAFITGTGLGSNIMFAQMHIDAAASLGMNPITIFAGQNAGASLGNLICPNNTVAACATVDQVGNESDVMKKTFKAFAIILVLYMVLAMLYTCVLFPNFGM